MNIYKLSKSIFFSCIMLVCLTPVIGFELSAGLSVLSVAASYLPMPQNVLGMNNTNNISARMSYEKAIEIYTDAWVNTDTFKGDRVACRNYVMTLKLSQNEIRLEVGLTGNKTAFKFALTTNQNNSSNLQFLTERRLDLQDALIANEYGIYIAKTAGQNDADYSLRTYPNSQDFTAAEASKLKNILYSNGEFGITCNKDIIMPNRGVFNHLYLPQTQETAPLGAGAAGDQIRGSEDGMITMEPNILLIGTKGYDMVLSLKDALGDDLTDNVRAILIYRGIMAQNATSVS